MEARRLSVAVLFLALATCGPSARQLQIRTTLTALDAASAGLIAYDTAHQASIIASAPSEPEGMAALTAYRARRAPVLAALGAAYEALATAATLDGPHTLKTALVAFALASKAWADLQGAP